MNQQQQVCQALDELGIEYQLFEHEPVFTVEDVNRHAGHIPGLGCKNLFLRDKKGVNHFLIVVPDDKRVDIQAIGREYQLGHLSFGSPERLMKCLGLTPGSVSPFGLLNDLDGAVQVLIDEELLNHELLNFHPNINTGTVVISSADFQKFLASRPNKLTFVNIK